MKSIALEPKIARLATGIVVAFIACQVIEISLLIAVITVMWPFVEGGIVGPWGLHEFAYPIFTETWLPTLIFATLLSTALVFGKSRSFGTRLKKGAGIMSLVFLGWFAREFEGWFWPIWWAIALIPGLLTTWILHRFHIILDRRARKD